jgi:diphthamide synthase (EF-2-diphthine--ammonia ligase)
MVTVREPLLDETWLGRALTADMKASFAARGIDPCGENGEYHTAVVDGPAFAQPIRVVTGECVRRGNCLALDLIPC